MDDREKLMELCRYYKGEKENPYKGEQNKACIWSYACMAIGICQTTITIANVVLEPVYCCWTYLF